MEYTTETPVQTKIDPKTGANIAPGMVSPEEAQKIQEQLDKGETPKPEVKPAAEEEVIEPTEEEVKALQEKAEKTPDQLTDDEKEFLESLEKPGEEPKKGKESEEEPEITAEEITALKAKAEADPDSLTKEEKEFLSEVTASEQFDSQEITIGGVKKTASELIAEMSTEDEIDYSQLSIPQRQKLLDRFVDSKNKKSWQASLTQSAQVNAEARKKNEALLLQSQANESRVQSALDDITSKIKKLEKFALSTVTEDDAKEDLKLSREFNRKLDAEEELPELRAKKDELEKQASQYAIATQVAEISLFQSANPQYQMGEQFTEVLRKHDEGQYDHPDADKLRDIVDVTRHSKEYGITFEAAFKDLAKLGRLRVKPQAETQNKKPDLPKPKPEQKETLAQKLARRQKNSTFFLPGKGGKSPLRSNAPKRPLGDVMREKSAEALGSTTKSANLDKAGY